jgi:hypothetical protein
MWQMNLDIDTMQFSQLIWNWIISDWHWIWVVPLFIVTCVILTFLVRGTTE